MWLKTTMTPGTNPQLKQKLLVAACFLVIVACCLWIYFTQIKAAKYNVGLHQRVGEVMAEQTAALLGKKGHVVCLYIPPREWPELKTELAAFRETLKKIGEFEVRDYELDTKDQPKYGVGSGLSGRRYVRTVNKNEKADLFVSFVGAPSLSEEEIKGLTAGKKPKLIALSRSTDNLPGLFNAQLINVAVVSRFHFPSPGTDNPRTPEEWFTKRFQIVTPESFKALPEQ
jgi:hypothetical protein